MITRRTSFVLACALTGAVALGACGSDSKSAGPYGGGTTSTSAAAATTTVATSTTVGTTSTTAAATSPVSTSVADHLASVHGLHVTVSADADGVVVKTSFDKTQTAKGLELCTDSAMVAGTASIEVDAADGTKLSRRAAGGQCA